MPALLAALAVVVGAVSVLVRRALRPALPGDVEVVRAIDDTTEFDHASGAVRSVQTAEVSLPADVVEGLWSPLHLERLARTYWRFLTRATLGLIRVYYTPRERFVCLLIRPLTLLTFAAPEYEMDDERGVVRWRIERGLLVASPGRQGDGYLEIDVRRRLGDADGMANVVVEVEVANFYPAIASRIGRLIYTHTQSRIHVLVTHGFLRSLARLDLEESVVGRFVRTDEVPSPSGPTPSQREHADTT